ncbi:oxidoreductase [Rhodococcus sp. D2-41]|uniref:PDR/VanB family oxidoreductase n=1 Tax=Speluncibacter jeojiensis TaxID=2710754 RepID=A0A9X4M3K9_9ACTN|nr:PDR/VanB family oxidoreductase [Rhodococcus sp. D2-41]MDG3008904.1 oxidoreductase [Rhodococcus sp. D2-41]MDG3016526.1 PDR/VanB family oxidoreductase [Corynebacteriales bacterium D3-21]
MTKFPVPQSVPADLFGKRDRDLLVGVVDTFAGVYLRSLRFLHRRDVDSPVDDHRIRLVVRARTVVAEDQDVVSLVLEAPGGGALPSWRPGAHLDLELPSGRLRQYSLCGDPADGHRYRIAVRRIPDGGGGSVEVHDRLAVGAELTVRGPRNAFAFAVPGHGSTAQKLRFVAGGIGITPILPMVRLAHRLGLDWSMVYTGRRRETLPFLDELASFGDRVTVRTDDVDGLPDAGALLGEVGASTAVYCCGPVPMLDVLRGAVRSARGVEFHFERFAAPPVVDGKEFEVELARTGEVVTVPADKTALEAIGAVRPDIPYSCRQGFCRTCEVRVLDGTPEHRDTTLTDEERENGGMLICVSRCAEGGRLVLDA